MDSQRSINDYDLGDLFQLEEQAAAGGGVIEDPYPKWAELLAQGPVHKGTIAEAMGLPPERSGGGLYRPGTTYYTVLGFNAVSDVFTRKDDFWSDAYHDMGTAEEFGDTILSMDGLRHRKFRDLLQPLFQPGLAETWWREKVIDPLVDDLVEGLQGKNAAEVNGGFFARLPLHTMTGGFGLTFGEGLELRQHMLVGLHAKNSSERMSARAATSAVFERAIREKRENPCDDLISSLVNAVIEEDDGAMRKLTDEEVTSYCRLIVFAGGETTWRQMGNALYALLSHPDQLADLQADRSLMSQTVLELVRWLGEPMFPRKVKRDTVLEGVELPEGAHLHVVVGAASRDPARWENPERFDIHRPFHRSVAFAAGAHSCLGQHVARQEISAALAALLDRFPNIRWDPDMPAAKLTGSLVQRGPGPMHVLLN